MLHLSTVLQDAGFSGFSGLLGFEKKKKKKTMSSVAVPWDSWPGGDKVIWDQIKPPVPKANAMEPDTEDECIFPSCGVMHKKGVLGCMGCGRQCTKTCMRNTGLIPEGVITDFLKKTERWVCPVCAWRRAPRTKVKKEKPIEQQQQDEEDDDAEDTVEGLLAVIPETAKKLFMHTFARLDFLQQENESLKKTIEFIKKSQQTALDADFSPYVVATWKNIQNSRIRKEIREKVGKAFRESTLPTFDNALEYQKGVLRCFEALDNSLALIEDSEDPPATKFLTPIHNTIVELTSTTIIGANAAGRMMYESKAKGYAVDDFSKVIQARIMDTAKKQPHAEVPSKTRDSGRDAKEKRDDRDRGGDDTRGRDRDYWGNTGKELRRYAGPRR